MSNAHIVCSSRLVTSSAHLVCSFRSRKSPVHLVGSPRQLICSVHPVCSSRLPISSAHLAGFLIYSFRLLRSSAQIGQLWFAQDSLSSSCCSYATPEKSCSRNFSVISFPACRKSFVNGNFSRGPRDFLLFRSSPASMSGARSDRSTNSHSCFGPTSRQTWMRG